MPSWIRKVDNAGQIPAGCSNDVSDIWDGSNLEILLEKDREISSIRIFVEIQRFHNFRCVSVMPSPERLFNGPMSRHHTTSRYHPKPLSQRNLLSAFFGLTAVVFLATAIVEPRWFHVKGGRCSGHYLGIYKMLTLSSRSTLSKYCVHDLSSHDAGLVDFHG